MGAASPAGSTRALLLATLSFFVSFAAWGLVGGLAPIFSELYGLSASQTALLVAVPVLVGSLGRIPVGALTDRFGGRVMFPIVSGVTIVPVLFIAFVALDSYIALLVGGFFLGVGGTAFAVGVPFVNAWFPPERRGFAISAHISGGNVGTVIAALAGPAVLAAFDWRGASILFGIPAALVGLAIWRWVRETGADRVAAIEHGTVREAIATIWGNGTIKRTYLASVFGGGGRGLGTANLFSLLYLTHVLRLPESTTNLMYAALIVLSVPMPLVAGWLSDRVGRRPTIVGAYVGGALGFIVFIAVGSSLIGLWAGIAIMGLFAFAESPQLQALLADVVPTGVRDVAFALYFTLAFGVGSLWTAVYGAIIEATGETAGLPIVFGMMAASFIAAAVIMWPVRDPPRQARIALAND